MIPAPRSSPRPLRVLMVNAFHYLRGGVERACFDETRWLTGAGHEVGHFAIRDPRNRPSPTEAHFAPFADYGEGAPLLRQVAQLPRAVWSRPAADAMKRLLEGFRPDIAHVHAPSRYLTPSVLRPLEAAGVPLVMTLHDFKPWCTNRVMFARGAPCERCRGGAHWNALATGCVQDSRLKSAVGAFEAYAHDAFEAYRAIRFWIAPSAFALEKVTAWGVSRDRVRFLGHGVERRGDGDRGARDDAPRAPAPGMARPAPDRGTALAAPPTGTARPAPDPGTTLPAPPYVLFAGRLTVEKGVRLLPDLAAALGEVPLVVAGEGPLGPLLAAAARRIPSLRLLGRLEGAAFAALRAAASVVIVPSLFYETYGYAVAEALLDGRPVVASRIGALPELIEHERTGLLVEPGDAAALAAAVRRALADPAAAEWAAAGRVRVRTFGNPSAHVQGLLAIYREAGA